MQYPHLRGASESVAGDLALLWFQCCHYAGTRIKLRARLFYRQKGGGPPRSRSLLSQK
jgi:hypothetical protein